MFEQDDYTADQAALADFAQRLGEEFDLAYFLDIAREGAFPERFWQRLCTGGYLGMLAAQEYGGAEATLEDMAVLVHNLARRGLVAHHLLQHFVCAELIERCGDDGQRKRWLPELISGNLCALALIERGEGRSLFDIETSATLDGPSYMLNGTKRWVAGAARASRLLVVARTAETKTDDPTQGLGLFLVDPRARGVEIVARELNVRVTADEEPVQITGDAFFDVIFDRVELSPENRVDEPGRIGEALLRACDLLLILTAVTTVGWGESVLEKAVEHAKTRAIFEQPIGAYQAIQHPMVRARTELELARLATERAIGAYEQREEEASVFAAVAKCTSSEAAYAACEISIQAHGGSGFDRETGVITLWPLILLSRILPLNNDVILERFAEAALDLPAADLS